jgi:hypothetical protein
MFTLMCRVLFCGRYSSCLGCSWLLCTAATLPLITVRPDNGGQKYLEMLEHSTAFPYMFHISLLLRLTLTSVIRNLFRNICGTPRKFRVILEQKISRHFFSV